MKRKTLSPLVFVVALYVLAISKGFPLEKTTHEYLNQQIARRTVNEFSLDSYLKNSLGFREGAQELLSGYSEVRKKEMKREVWEWMGEGGIKEDEPEQIYRQIAGKARNKNHFHNPLGGLWTYSGLDDTFVFHYSGQSSILWAMNPNQDPGGKWSWYDARDYFYKALTLTDKAQRDSAMVNCFRGVGQLMHLIQDASVPSHSRNEIHIGFEYERWVERIRTGNADERALFGQFIANPITFDPSILDVVPLDPSVRIPIANIIDTDKYSGSNPDVTTGTAIGIAEYVNANFFSERGIFKTFPYPAETSADKEDREISDPRGVKPSVMRQYYIKKRDGESAPSSESLAEGKQGYRLATVGYLYDYITKYFPIYRYKDKRGLDGGVYNDYAEKLLPLAVGYSAGLLQYFFRGNLYVGFLVPSVNQAIYDVGNANDTGRDIDTVAFFIQNNTKLNGVIEPIGEGTISVTVSYIDSRTGETVYQSAGTGSVTNIPDVGSENALTALFTLAQPIPTQFARELTYYLVFRGQLGKEEDAVIGKVVRAPVLQSVLPDQGVEGTIVTITGDYLPEIEGPFPTTSRNVNFNHDTRWPYIAEVINRTDTEITAKVPNSAAIVKPGYGGLRVRRVVPETEEMIYSNPMPFFPIAEGEVRNSGKVPINATIEAVKPMIGDYNQLPQPVSYPVLAGDSVLIQLITGFTYKATANTSSTQDIWAITPDATDFVFDLQ